MLLVFGVAQFVSSCANDYLAVRALLNAEFVYQVLTAQLASNVRLVAHFFVVVVVRVFHARLSSPPC